MSRDNTKLVQRRQIPEQLVEYPTTVSSAPRLTNGSLTHTKRVTRSLASCSKQELWGTDAGRGRSDERW